MDCRALDRDPFDLSARFGVANSLASMGRLREAVEEYDKARQIAEASQFVQAPVDSLLRFASLLVVQNLRKNPADRSWRQVEEVLSE